jgi:hypothetical protein
VVKSLVKAYFLQLSKGCSSTECTNPRCATSGAEGPVAGNAAAAAAVRLATESLAKRHTQLCLGDEQRTFSRSVTALEAMGFPAGWGALALIKLGQNGATGEHDAAVWLISNYTPPE